MAQAMGNASRKQAEAERFKLEVQNRQLQKAESLGRMAGAIAHHFNNQLMTVMLNLEVGMKGLPRNARPYDNLGEAMQAARKASEVSRLMMTYLGQTNVQLELLDLAEACLRGLPMFRAAAPQGVVWDVDLPAPGPVVQANANQIHQVLTNLLTNAWEASNGGRSAIRLSVKEVAAANIPAAKRFPVDFQLKEDAYACLEVADKGCGMKPHELEKLFDPFFTSKFTGRGLGLPVVLGIVRAHQGAVTVESEPGQGSVFRVFLPLSTEALA
jgi:signal transduction histidine kinase